MRYNTPEEGTTDWHLPLNKNFNRLDTDVEVRDIHQNIEQYTPKEGAKFFAIDSGKRFLGNGSEWIEAPSQPRTRLIVPDTKADPSDPTAGQVWYREDLDEVRTKVGDEIIVLASASDTDSPEHTYDALISFNDESWTNQFRDQDHTQSHHNTSVVSTPSIDANALNIVIEKDESYGCHFMADLQDNIGHYPEEVHARWHLYIDDNLTFGYDYANGGKLPGLSHKFGTYGSGNDPVDGTNGWTARMAFRPPQAEGDLHIGQYIYSVDHTGDTFPYNEHGELETNRWYQIDNYVKMNTPGEYDGQITAWVDGNLAWDKNDFKFRNEGYGDEIKIGEWWLNVYMGGSYYSDDEMDIYIDELMISETPIDDSLPQP